MLEDLKRANRNTELLSLFQIGDGAIKEFPDMAQAFGTSRCRATIDRLLDRRKSIALATQESIGADFDVAKAVLGPDGTRDIKSANWIHSVCLPLMPRPSRSHRRVAGP